MAKKGKAKISKQKRNNQTTNKMKKQGKLKLQRHRQKPVQKQRQAEKPEVEYSSEGEASNDEWADMLDDDEQKYILSRLAKQPQLLSNVPEKEDTKPANKRKRSKEKGPKPAKHTSDSGADSEGMSDSDVEDKYEKEMSERPAKRLRQLLPIKTKQGLQERNEEREDTESEEEKDEEQTPQEPEESGSDDGSDSGMEVEAEGEGGEKEIGVVELMAARRDKLQNDKLRIGALCSSLLESPEKKIKNLYPVLYLMEERLKDGTLNLVSIRKLATVSAFEVFKDILPDYKIRHQDYSNVKLKKDTLALYKYEKELLEFYKRFLQRLEKATMVLRKKKGDNRVLDDATLSLAVVSLRCLCGMLQARPAFNFAENIAQSVVPFLDSRVSPARELVANACGDIFDEDQKGEVTLTIVRLINQLVKRRGSRLHPGALGCLLRLRARDVDLDARADAARKKKQDEKHKKRIVNLSKKEKKRQKKLKEVERELLETQAQESSAARSSVLADVTRQAFHIYFRLLKTAPPPALLAAALDGIAKFTHVINLEFYSDLVSILEGLIRSQAVGPREQLRAVCAALAVLAGAGDVLAVDPHKLHQHLYVHAIRPTAATPQEDFRLVLQAVLQVTGRARRVSGAVLAALAKRLAALAVQQLPHAALAALAALRNLAQQSKHAASLLEYEGESWGSGQFDPLAESPEHCGAPPCVRELCSLAAHYHPAVAALARGLLNGTCPAELAKLTPMQIYEQYDGSQMSFKPPVPAPKSVELKNRVGAHTWTQTSLRELCERVESELPMTIT